MSFKLGLTGSIGMGKSTTAAMFRAQGIPVWDADETVHRLYGPGGAAVAPLTALIPQARYDDTIDRTALKDAIAHDPALLDRIEKIVHPLVAQDRATFLADHADQSLVVMDIPLLFETGADAWLDAVLVVTTDPDTQRARVLARPGMHPKALDHILSRQIPDAEKRARADVVIETTTLDQTRRAVAALIADLQEKARKDA